MTRTPIADYWREIERLSGAPADGNSALMRSMYFAGAMAAVHELTGWDPDAGPQVLTVDSRSLILLCLELAEAYSEPTVELYAEGVGHA